MQSKLLRTRLGRSQAIRMEKNYPTIFNMIRSGVVAPKTVIDRELSLEEGADLLTRMDQFPGTGVAVITSF